MIYSPTDLEVWIAKLYKRLGFHTPYDIKEEIIAYYFHIFLSRKDLPSSCFERGRFKSITIDQRLPVEVQREAFYHELCHLLRHCGWQLGMMPQAFKELQEWDSHRFTSYAAIPYTMLRGYDFNDPNIILTLSDAFKVTPELCEKRIKRMFEQAKVGDINESCTLFTS